MHALHHRARLAFLMACGFAAGLLGGLLGAGGGIILVFAISRLCRTSLPDNRDVYANALVVTLALATTSAALYIAGGNAPPAELSSLVLPAAAGGLAGGLLLGRISSESIKLVFAVILVLSGVAMILR